MGAGKNPDVDHALDLFIGDTTANRPLRRKVSSRKGRELAVAKEAESEQTRPAEEFTHRRITTSWVGRLPGHKTVNRRPKSKTTLRIDAELMNEFRERVFVERRPLGEIIESAMRLLKQKKWNQDG